MAFAAILVSIPLASLSSLAWLLLIGGSFLRFLLVYAASAQIGFVVALLVFLVARHLHSHTPRQEHRELSFDKLA